MKRLLFIPVLALVWGCNQQDLASPQKEAQVVNEIETCVSPLSRSYSEQVADGRVRILQGELNTVIQDHSDETHEEFAIFDTADGESYLIDKADPALSSLPRGERIDLAIEASVVQASGAPRPLVKVLSSSSSQDSCAKSSADLSTKNVTKNRQLKRIGVFVFNMNKTQAEANAHAQRIADYFNIAGNGNWNVVAEAHLIDLSESECSTLNENMSSCVMSKAQSYASSIGKSYNYYTTIQYLRSYGICGHGYMPGSRNWNYCGFNVSTQTHEIGHNHGLGHASLVTSDGSISEYGDRTSTMGTGSTARFTAPHVEKLRIYNDGGVKSVSQTQKVFLLPLEAGISDMFDSVYQMATFRKGGRDYFVSARSTGGAFEVSSRDARKVFIHYNGTSNKAVRLADIEQGESVTVNGFRVDFIDRQDGITKVDIYINSTDTTPPDQNFPVRGETVKISMSKTGSLSGSDTTFRLGVDTITYRVTNGGVDAFGCIAYEAADGSRGNKSEGHCDSLDDFTDMKTQAQDPDFNEPWIWNSSSQTWDNESNLINHPTFIKGQYWMYWYNPDTEQLDEYIFEII